MSDAEEYYRAWAAEMDQLLATADWRREVIFLMGQEEALRLAVNAKRLSGVSRDDLDAMRDQAMVDLEGALAEAVLTTGPTVDKYYEAWVAETNELLAKTYREAVAVVDREEARRKALILGLVGDVVAHKKAAAAARAFEHRTIRLEDFGFGPVRRFDVIAAADEAEAERFRRRLSLQTGFLPDRAAEADTPPAGEA